MRAVALLAALLLAGPGSAALPREGVLEPSRSLGGLRLGATEAQVRAAWGPRFGVCRRCADETWYFTYRAFRPEGAGAAFRTRRVAGLFTLWSPAGWRTVEGLRLGDHVARVTALYGPLTRSDCGTYYALALPRDGTVTAFYVVDDKVWGFGLSRAEVPLCR